MVALRVFHTNPLAESFIRGGEIHRIRVSKLQVEFIWHRPPLVLRIDYYPEPRDYLSTVASSYRFLGAYCVNNNII